MFDVFLNENDPKIIEVINCMKNSQWKDSIIKWNNILEDNKNVAEYHALLALCYGKVINLNNNVIEKYRFSQEMDKQIEKSININNECTIAYLIRGIKYIESPKLFGQDLKKAIEDLRFCVDKGFEIVEVYHYLGIAYLKLKDKEKAIRNFEHALSIKADYKLSIEEIKKVFI